MKFLNLLPRSVGCCYSLNFYAKASRSTVLKPLFQLYDYNRSGNFHEIAVPEGNRGSNSNCLVVGERLQENRLTCTLNLETAQLKKLAQLNKNRIRKTAGMAGIAAELNRVDAIL